MTNIGTSTISKAAALVLILGIALWLRLPFISTGLPFIYDEDEGHHFNRTIEMFQRGDLNPHYFHKPSLHFYLRLPAIRLAYDIAKSRGLIASKNDIRTKDPYGLSGFAYTASHPFLVKAARSVSLLMSLGIVLLTFLIALQAFKNYFIAEGASLLAAVAPGLVSHSCIIAVDTPMTFMCLAAVSTALLVSENFSLKNLAWCALLSGFAVSTKYNAAPVALLPLFLCWQERRLQLTPLLISLFVPALGFFLGSPYILSSFNEFQDQALFEVKHYAIYGHEGHEGERGIQQAIFFFRWFLSEGLGQSAAVFGVLGLAVCALRLRKREFALLFFPVLYFLLMSMQKANFTRNMVVMVPFLCIGAAVFLYLVFASEKLAPPLRKILIVLFMTLAASAPLMSSTSLRFTAKTDTDSRSEFTAFVKATQSGISDLSVAGQIQPPLSLYDVRGVSRFNQNLVLPYNLYLSGFDRIALAPARTLTDEEKRFLVEEKIFPGVDEPQRVPKNPLIRVFRFKEDYFLKKTPAELLVPSPGPAIVAQASKGIFKLGGKYFCRETYTKLLEQQSEAYCWVDRRADQIKFQDLPALREKISGTETTLALDVMSPWPNQHVEFFADEWHSDPLALKDPPGEWQTIRITIPWNALKKDSLWIRTSEVHSPSTQGEGTDGRRLGIAIKTAEFSSK